MITLFQINLSDEEIDAVNAGNFVPAYNARRDAGMGYKFVESKGVLEAALGFYEPTMVVDANDLEELFELTNLWAQPSRVDRIVPSHSTSVGDIAVTDEGKVFFCDNFGWQEVEAA